MTIDDWTAATKAKVEGSWNLHSLLPSKMVFFILASSMTGIFGQATQINYAAGNTFQDALAKYRISIGEKAASIDLGIIEAEILGLFEYFCDPSLDLSKLPSQVAAGIVPPSLHGSRDMETPAAFHQPLWRHTLDTSGDDKTDPALDTSQIREIITNALVDRFCRLTLIPYNKLDLDKPLHAAGADSLTAVDLRSWVVKEFGVDVPVFDILGDMSIAALCGQIAREWEEAKKP
ncbi:hypothetical protein ZTR_05079 [Talaromyces verruculosus]|nr:hypothetical protein ZTR_05079 [Talaromyces verruculosus]